MAPHTCSDRGRYESQIAAQDRREADVPAHDLNQYYVEQARSEECVVLPGCHSSATAPEPLATHRCPRRYTELFRLPTDEALQSERGCSVWDPCYRQAVPGRLYLSKRYMCFASEVVDDCSLILPFRELLSAELTDVAQSSRGGLADVENTVYLTTRSKSSFMLGNLSDPGALVTIIQEGLTARQPSVLRPGQTDASFIGTPTKRRDADAPGSSSTPARSAIPLYRRFGTESGPAATTVKTGGDAPINAVKEHLWSVHFSEYGSGVCMFRSRADRELIMKGVPESLRSKVWMLYSGALNDSAELR